MEADNKTPQTRTASDPNAPMPHTLEDGTPEFTGYSLEELRYRRTVTMLRKEFCREKMLNDYNKVRRFNPLSPGPGGFTGRKRRSGLFGKIASSLSYMDYALLGFQVFGTARKMFSLFKRKR